MKKEKYITPAIEVIHMESEGVIAVSGNFSDIEGKPWGKPVAITTHTAIAPPPS